MEFLNLSNVDDLTYRYLYDRSSAVAKTWLDSEKDMEVIFEDEINGCKWLVAEDKKGKRMALFFRFFFDGKETAFIDSVNKSDYKTIIQKFLVKAKEHDAKPFTVNFSLVSKLSGGSDVCEKIKFFKTNKEYYLLKPVILQNGLSESLKIINDYLEVNEDVNEARQAAVNYVIGSVFSPEYYDNEKLNVDNEEEYICYKFTHRNNSTPIVVFLVVSCGEYSGDAGKEQIPVDFRDAIEKLKIKCGEVSEENNACGMIIHVSMKWNVEGLKDTELQNERWALDFVSINLL